MKDNTDYFSSSTSIYKTGSFCVIEHNRKAVSYCFDSTGISQKRDKNNLILTVSSAIIFLAMPDIQSKQYVIDKLVKSGRGYKCNNLVVSLGAGSGITEISSNTLTLCLDIDKRAIHTGLNEINGRQCINRTILH